MISFCTLETNTLFFKVLSHGNEREFVDVFISTYRMESIIEIRRRSASLSQSVFLGSCLNNKEGKSIKLAIGVRFVPETSSVLRKVSNEKISD